MVPEPNVMFWENMKWQVIKTIIMQNTYVTSEYWCLNIYILLYYY